MQNHEQNTFFYLRLIFCVSLVAIWSFWLLKQPEERRETAIRRYGDTAKEQRKETAIEQKKETARRRDGETAIEQRKEIARRQDKIVNLKLPSLANLVLKTEAEKQRSKEAKIENDTAIEQKKETAREQKTEITALRKKVPVDKSKYKPVLKILSENNKQLAPDEEAKLKIATLLSNLEKISNQLELVGLINNTNGPGAAIIKDTTNNKIEIIKQGEEYLGLELLEIHNNEIVLGNKNLNQAFTKKIVTVER